MGVDCHNVQHGRTGLDPLHVCVVLQVVGHANREGFRARAVLDYAGGITACFHLILLLHLRAEHWALRFEVTQLSL